MQAKNTSKGALHLESGVVSPGENGEFTAKEFKFLSGMGRAEVYKIPTAPAPKKKVAKKSAPDAPGFM